MGELSEEPEAGEPKDELEELRSELRERYPEKDRAAHPDESKSELEELRDELAEQHPKKEEPS